MLRGSRSLDRADPRRVEPSSRPVEGHGVGDGRELAGRGVGTEQPRVSGSVGRPGTLVRLTGPNRTFATLTWYGRSMRIVVCEFGGTIVDDRSVTLSAQLTPDELAAIVTKQADLTSVIGVVLSLPAPFQPGVGIPPPGPAALGAELADSLMWPHGRWLSGDPVPALARALAALGEVAPERRTERRPRTTDRRGTATRNGAQLTDRRATDRPGSARPC